MPTIKNDEDFLPGIIRDCRAAGVNAINVAFDGCGDDGQIDHVVLLDVEGKHKRCTTTYPVEKSKMVYCDAEKKFVPTTYIAHETLEDRIEAYVYSRLDASGVDWVNNDGGFGAWNLNNILSDEPALDFVVEYRVTTSEVGYSQQTTINLEAK